MLRILLLSILFPLLAFADIKVTDSRGLTRASLSDADIANVTVAFRAGQTFSNVRLISDDGLNKVLNGDVQGKEVVFSDVSSGNWKVDSDNLKYQVRISKK